MMNMEDYDAYKIYIALKSHFNSDYDFNKYNGKTSVSVDSFLKRNDRPFFGKVGRKYKDDTKEFFISNFIKDPKGWVGNFTDDNFVQYQKRKQSLKYTYENDVLNLLRKYQSYDKLFEVKDGQHPMLLKQFLGDKVQIETMCIFETLFDYCKEWDKQISEKIVWPVTKKLIKNYNSVLTFDVDSYRVETIKLYKEYL